MAAIWYLEQADISRVNNGYSVLILKYRNFRSPTSALQMTFSGDFTFSFLVQRQVPVRSIEIDWFEQARLICLEKKFGFLVLQDVLESVVHTRCLKWENEFLYKIRNYVSFQLNQLNLWFQYCRKGIDNSIERPLQKYFPSFWRNLGLREINHGTTGAIALDDKWDDSCNRLVSVHL